LQDEPHTKPPAGNDTVPNLDELVSSVIERWRSGEQPNTAKVLDSHPELRAQHSVVLNLAAEEYELRKQAGEKLSRKDFSDRFPSFQKSIVRDLEVREYMAEHPDISSDMAAEFAGPAWPQLGDDLADFTIAEALGRGALARVYLARQKTVGNRLVVVKVAEDGESEAQLLGKLAHENIMEIYSVQRDELTGLTVICTPLVGTATLVDLLERAFQAGQIPTSSNVIPRVARQRQPVGTPAADLAADSRPAFASYVEAIAHLGLQLARALEAAHRAGITHRDIKPSNVLLSWSGRPLLLDFNLSTDPLQPLKRLGGTHAYMPPERLRAVLARRAELDQRTDPRADIYSWGVLVYQLLAGKLPFSAQSDSTDEDEQSRAWLECRSTPPPALRALNPQVDAEIAAIVMRAISPAPAARQATAQELAEQLERYLTVPSRARRFAGRNRRSFLAAGLVGLAGLASGAAYLVTRPDFVTRQYRTGLGYYDRGDWQAAADCFSESLHEDQRNLPALYARGQTFRQLENFAAARSDFQTYLELSPRVEAYLALADCELQLKSFRKAKAVYQEALAQRQESAAIENNLAYCDYHFASDGALDIRAAASRALELDSQMSSARYMRAAGALRLVKSKSGKVQKLPLPADAFTDVEELLRSSPTNIEVRSLAANLYEFAAATNPAHRALASEQLQKLLELGANVETLRISHDPALVAVAQAAAQRSRAIEPTGALPLYVSPSDSPVLAK
jgi:tetratricopeptide (TPR) repeat protein